MSLRALRVLTCLFVHCFLLVVGDVSSQHPEITALPVCSMPPHHDSNELLSPGTISLNKSFLLQIALVMVFCYNNRKVIYTIRNYEIKNVKSNDKWGLERRVSREPGFGSCHLHGSSQLSITLVPGDAYPLLTSARSCICVVHVYTQEHTHTHKK